MRAAIVVVEAGIVLVVARPDGATREMIVAISRPGDVLCPPGPDERLAALTDATLTVVPALACRVLLASPELAAALTERLLAAMCERQESLARFATVDHCERVRQKLLQLARAHGRVGHDGIHLDLPLTHELLAQTTGSARETVTVALASLQREGFVVRDGRRYRLLVQPDQVEKPEPATIRGSCSTRSSTPSTSSSTSSRRSGGARSGSPSACT